MKNKNYKRSPVSAVCSALGTILLVVIILCCIPMTLPRLLGYEVYTVISGSMEPSIPTGSLVFVGGVNAAEVEVDDVIAFYGGRDSNAIITHRVVENHVVMGEFITKGDANEDADMNPVNYQELIGRVELSVPMLGVMAQFLTSLAGKVTAAGAILAAVLLHVIAAIFDRK